MLPATAEWLVRMRMKGRKPEWVYIRIGDDKSDWFAYRETWGSPVLTVAENSSIDRLDLRCLVGLNVIVIAEKWGVWVAELWEAMKAANPAYCSLIIRDWVSRDCDDWGFHWRPGMEDTSLAEGVA